LPLGSEHELLSNAERLKFQRMGKISDSEVQGVDLDDLERRLQGL
jgi:hypothetical protein